MFIVCECKDNKTLNVIKPFVEEALLACDFFRINNKNNFEIPKFGDISPDADPNWLIEILISPLVSNKCDKKRKGWASLFCDAETLISKGK